MQQVLKKKPGRYTCFIPENNAYLNDEYPYFYYGRSQPLETTINVTKTFGVEYENCSEIITISLLYRVTI